MQKGAYYIMVMNMTVMVRPWDVEDAMNEELYEGIVKALEKKKEGAGSYGRPRASLPEDFREQVEYCQKNHIPLETYRRRTSLKKATFTYL